MASATNLLFERLKRELDGQRHPPVHLWHPERDGRIDIRITPDGRWFHEGDEIKRLGLVRLFASILRRDDDGYCLVTPVERMLITVEDAPFLVTDFEVQDAGGSEQRLLFTTSLGEHVLLDADHPLEMASSADAPRPYLQVRPGLPGLIARSAFYRLIDVGREAQDGRFLVRSAGEDYLLGQL
ncbi:MAG: DUF1285 domain-containing protein [Pseudomonadota bacterium]